jgi:hypothetical protein
MSWLNLTEQQTQLAYPDNTAPAAPLLIPLAQYSLLRVQGEDAGAFLQNLLTNDVNALQIGQSQLSGFCNPKGRLLTVFQLIRRENDYLLLLPADLAEAIAQRLTMFKLRSKVDITVADDLHAFGLVYTDTETDSSQVWQGHQTDEGLMLRQPGAAVRDLVIADTAQCHTLAERLNNNCQLAAEAYWQLLDIEAGLPMVFTDSKEAFTPQQLNLELVGGVSFKKGCYPGQEVVARLHYLGSPSRRMFLGTIQDTQLPAINSPVTDARGDVLGHVVQAQFVSTGKVLCQLSMKLAGLETTALLNGNEVQSLTALAEEAAD